MKPAAIAAIGMLSAVPVQAADTDGQYLCKVEHVAGILTHSDGTSVSGHIRIPDNRMSFVLKRETIVQLSGVGRSLCRNALDYWATDLDRRRPYRPYDAPKGGGHPTTPERAQIAEFCWAPEKATLTYPGERMPSTMYAMSYLFVVGGDSEEWLRIYGDGSFRMLEGYDEGPVVEAGRCAKLP